MNICVYIVREYILNNKKYIYILAYAFNESSNPYPFGIFIRFIIHILEILYI